MVRIPSEYQEVEYIESTGTQYIDTGYIPVLSPILRMKIRVTDKLDRDIAGFAFNVYPSFIIDSAPAQSRWYNRYGDTVAYDVNPDPVVGQLQEWEWGKEVKFNGNLVYTNTECDWSSNTQKMNIFSGRNKAFVAIYSCSLYDGELVRNFIPCYRKSDNEIGMYDTVTGTFFTNQGTRTFLKGNDVNYDTINLLESRRRILLNTPHLESLTGSALSFKTDMASNLKECKIHFTPVQEGSGDPSPENVRPIVGWDGMTMTRCGKNLFDKASVEKWYYIAQDGSIVEHIASIPCWTISNYIPVTPNSKITYTGLTNVGTSPYSAWYDESKNLISTFKQKIGTKTLIVPSTASFVRFSVRAATPNNLNSFMVVNGESISDYEPYIAQSLTIPFPQTIYGGYVDLVNGEVVEEYGAFEFTGDENINYATSWNSNGNYYINDVGVVPFCSQSASEIYCNILESVKSSFFNANANQMSTVGSDDDVINRYRYILWGKDGFGETVNECKAKLKELYDAGTPLTVVSKYAKAFVKTHQLSPDPVTIRTLKGLNNIWSDANGNIEIKYWTH